MQRVLIFGGTFNPVHVGHVRACIAISEALDFERVDWVPNFAPLHKPGMALLRFDLRVALLCAALEGHQGFRVNEIERNLPVPSVTIQMLEALSQSEPATERHFLLGDREFLRLHKWRNGAGVVRLADLVVVARTEFDRDAYAKSVAEAWPESKRVEAPAGALLAFELLPGNRAVVVPMQRVDVSSSAVRQEWLAGQDVSHLVPKAALALMEKNRDEIRETWSAADATARADLP